MEEYGKEEHIKLIENRDTIRIAKFISLDENGDLLEGISMEGKEMN